MTHPPEALNSPACETILTLLEPIYGPFVWEPRHKPIDELVFTILSQHTSDSNSERAFDALVRRFQSMEAVARSEVEMIRQCIELAGLSQIKAPRIRAVLREIQHRLGSLDISFLKDVPLDEAKAWMQSLPGIGPKTAAVVLCFAFGMPAMPVDTHVHRIAKRLGLIAEATTADKAHPMLEAMVAPENVFAFHLSLISHGRLICKARRPLCSLCVLAISCPSSTT
jgi:endonuclease-3